MDTSVTLIWNDSFNAWSRRKGKREYQIKPLETRVVVISSGFSTYSEAKASEYVENPEEMFSQYYMPSVKCIMFRYQTMIKMSTKVLVFKAVFL